MEKFSEFLLAFCLNGWFIHTCAIEMSECYACTDDEPFTLSRHDVSSWLAKSSGVRQRKITEGCSHRNTWKRWYDRCLSFGFSVIFRSTTKNFHCLLILMFYICDFRNNTCSFWPSHVTAFNGLTRLASSIAYSAFVFLCIRTKNQVATSFLFRGKK